MKQSVVRTHSYSLSSVEHRKLFMTLRRIVIFIASLLPSITLVLLGVHGVHADCTSGSCVTNPLRINSVNDFLKLVFVAVMRIGMIVISCAIVLVGFQFVIAQGKPDALKKARENALYTIIGACLILGAWLITTILSDTANSLTT